jgi:hypothetical protein
VAELLFPLLSIDRAASPNSPQYLSPFGEIAATGAEAEAQTSPLRSAAS